MSNTTTLSPEACSGSARKGMLEGVDLPVFLISGGVLVLFAIMALYDLEFVSGLVNSTFALSTKYFGAYWQVLLLLTFVIGLFLTFGRTGSVMLGGLKKPEMSTFNWVSILMCTLLAGGGVFWAAAEPMAHFTSPPPAHSRRSKAEVNVSSFFPSSPGIFQAMR